MKIIKRDSDSLVIYAGNDISIDSNASYGDGWQDLNVNTENAELLNVTLPLNFACGAYTYLNGVWNLVHPEIINVPDFSLDISAQAAILVTQLNADTDSIYAAAIGNRGPEYDQAAADATAYKNAGYTGAVPASVQSWATAKQWTAQQATDDILTAATNLNAARDAIRANRLMCKVNAQEATEQSQLNEIRITWNSFVAYICAQLGI